jgi:hypothetical protein
VSETPASIGWAIWRELWKNPLYTFILLLAAALLSASLLMPIRIYLTGTPVLTRVTACNAHEIHLRDRDSVSSVIQTSASNEWVPLELHYRSAP